MILVRKMFTLTSSLLNVHLVYVILIKYIFIQFIAIRHYKGDGYKIRKDKENEI